MKPAISVALAATLALAATAHAGDKANVPVTFKTNAQGHTIGAFGMAGTARNSADTKQSIGCFVSALGNSLQAGCEAQNAAGGYVSCTTTGAALVTAAGAVGPDSYIDFSHDGAGNCNSIYVANGSSNAVKQP